MELDILFSKIKYSDTAYGSVMFTELKTYDETTCGTERCYGYKKTGSSAMKNILSLLAPIPDVC